MRLSWLLMPAAVGCAHVAGSGELSPPDADVISQYAAVRAGAAAGAGHGYRFVRTGDAIEARRTRPIVADETVTMLDEQVESTLGWRLTQDPSLAGLPVVVHVHDRLVELGGIADDAQATVLIYEALALPGVDAVYARLDSSSSRGR